MMNALISEAEKRGISKIIGYYYPTSKNRMVMKFYDTMGYKLINEDDSGNSQWQLDLSDYKARILHMKVIN